MIILPVHRVNTLLSILPAIHRMDMGNITSNGTYTYVNDSLSQSFIEFAIPYVNDTLFLSTSQTLSECLRVICDHLNSTLIDTISIGFSYSNLYDVLTGTFTGILRELEELIRGD